GVKSYTRDNLYNRKGADQHFKFFIGFQNKVCTNLCIWTDGFQNEKLSMRELALQCDMEYSQLSKTTRCITSISFHGKIGTVRFSFCAVSVTVTHIRETQFIRTKTRRKGFER